MARSPFHLDPDLAGERQVGVGQVQVRGVVVAQPGGVLVTPGELGVR
jgi:hypothetical protein